MKQNESMGNVKRKVAAVMTKHDAEKIARELEVIGSTGEQSVSDLKEALRRAQGCLQACAGVLAESTRSPPRGGGSCHGRPERGRKRAAVYDDDSDNNTVEERPQRYSRRH